MFAPLVVSWLGSAEALPGEQSLLETWAKARGAHAILAPSPSPPPYDARTVEEIEAALENARAAVEAAPAELARAERLLLAHPELPQAAWLLAERHALAAQAGAGGQDALEVELQSVRARALEGARAAPAGAPPVSPPAAGGVAPEPHAAASARLALPAARPRDAVFVDGVPAEGAALAPGRHHVRLLRAGHLVWAGWLDAGVEPGSPPADPTRACSPLDLAGVEISGDRPRPAPGVLCPSWAAARRGPLGGLDVSLCNGSSCAAWEHLGAGADPSAERARATRWPEWLTWTLVGAGAAATAGVVLWTTGAFERSEPGTAFVFTGPSAAAYNF
ncbi:MAG TPA: hypothetical protein VNN80_05755 [Polyangiaceae bacterium]|nr:hypothetical protein [Polyangiaceae bacterium]